MPRSRHWRLESRRFTQFATCSRLALGRHAASPSWALRSCGAQPSSAPRPSPNQHLLAKWFEGRGKPGSDKQRLHRQTPLYRKGQKTRIDEEDVISVGDQKI